METNYKEYYQKKLEQGIEYQDFVVERLYDVGLPIISYGSKKYQHLIGENKAGFEIKYDTKFKETGNFYIETDEKSHPDNPRYVRSGVYRNDNTWLYIIGDYYNIYIFGKIQLQFLDESGKFRKVQTDTSIGYLLDLKRAKKYVLKEIIIEDANKD